MTERASTPVAGLRCGDRVLEFGTRTYVMGIVNVTPDSFSDGGRFLDPVTAYDQAMQLIDDGADIIDLGAESTRPGATPVDRDTELTRLLPVVDRLIAAGVRNLSIDTLKASVARAALDLGASWINDVSGLGDPDMAVAAAGADALVLMHQRPMSTGKVEDRVSYENVVADVRLCLVDLAERAAAAGVDRARMIIDPGIGFGKTIADNVALIAAGSELRDLGHPLLVGPSRKRFLTALAGSTTEADRDSATVGACCAAALAGADIVRVHAVRSVKQALAVVDACRIAR